MSFISLTFLEFFPLVVLLFFLLPHKFRWFVLLTASCIFYMAFIPQYILVLLFTIVIDYFAAIVIETLPQANRKKWLILSIIANIGVLAIFKYYNFFLDNFRLTAILPVLKLALPIGLSFHTFQAIAYTTEVYRGNQKAERHFGIYALYILFFPQLVAGPIERPQNMLHQFHEKKTFNYRNAVTGLRLILWGFFKKIVIADRLGIVTDYVYNAPGNYSSWALVTASFFFAFQIYCDFSGYSDIALGTARMMGFRLMRNFNFPYQSHSLVEFWTRWHISLSTWFRDYVYIPLGGNRVHPAKWYCIILFVFILSGFWHGPNWTFIAWGTLNGIYILLEKITKKYRHAFIRFIKWENTFPATCLYIISTFLFILTGWVFFRAKNMDDALAILYKQKSLFPDLMNAVFHHKSLIGIAGVKKKELILCVLLILGVYVSEIIISKNPFNGFYLPSKRPFRLAIYYIIIALIILTGVFEKRGFIYFQF